MDLEAPFHLLGDDQQRALDVLALVASFIALVAVGAFLGAVGKLLSDAAQTPAGKATPPRALSPSAPGGGWAFGSAGGAVTFFLPPPPSAGAHGAGRASPDEFDVHGAWLKFEESNSAGAAGGCCAAVGSHTRKVYHRPSCGWAERIRPANVVRFASSAAVKSSGYRPCRRCDPLGFEG